MAVSLNLTVGILGELSLGHAGFMSVGAFAGVIASQSLLDVVPSAGLRLTIAMIVGALFATIAGFIILRYYPAANQWRTGCSPFHPHPWCRFHQ